MKTRKGHCFAYPKSGFLFAQKEKTMNNEDRLLRAYKVFLRLAQKKREREQLKNGTITPGNLQKIQQSKPGSIGQDQK